MSLLPVVLLVWLQGATIEGVVMKPGGAEPLPGARVRLSTDTKEYLGTTEEDGRFTLTNVPYGDYTLSALHPRYGTATFGQRRPGGPGSTISITAGATVSGLKISMFPTGTIAGRISQRNGEPAVRATVQAFQYAYRDGRRTLVQVRATTANDLGEYRLFWLNPGRYLVAATSGTAILVMPPAESLHVETSMTSSGPQSMVYLRDIPVGAQVIRRLLDDGTVEEESWMPIYYPSTTEARDATAIEVSSGATMNGVNITIGPTPARKVSGQVIVPAGVVSRVTIAEMTGTGGLWRTTQGPSFEFKGLRAGSYVIFAEDGRNFGSAVIPVEVGDRDVDNIRIALRPKITLAGTVKLDGPAGQEQPFAGLVITLTQGNIELPMAVFQPDPNTGAFTVPNVNPGDYQLLLRSTQQNPQSVPGTNPRPLSVKSVRLGQTDASNGISITEGTQDRLEITLTRDSGSLEGTVTEPGRSGAANATVVLVPAVARKNTALYRSTISDASGKFRFQGIVPGDYLLFAWSDVENGAWQNADFMKPFEARGQRVQVSANGQQDIQIPLIAMP